MERVDELRRLRALILRAAIYAQEIKHDMGEQALTAMYYFANEEVQQEKRIAKEVERRLSTMQVDETVVEEAMANFSAGLEELLGGDPE